MVTAAGGSPNVKSRPVTNGAYYAASVLYEAGFRGWPLTIMTAIAGVESNWSPTELNNNASTKDYSVGLTQINYFGSLLPGRTAQYGSPAQLEANPAAQAAATYQLAGGNALTGLGNWGGGAWNGQNGSKPSFTEAGYAGAFAAHLPQAAAAVGQVGTFGPAPASTTAQASQWPGTTGRPAVTTGGFTSAADLLADVTPPTSGCGAYVGSNSAEPNQIFTIPHTTFGLTMCNWKAIKGGTILAAGAGLCVFAVAVVVIAGLGQKTPVGRALTSVVGSKGSAAASRTASSGPSASTLAGSPSRSGSASSHAKPRSVGREPDEFTADDETIDTPYHEQRRAA